MSEDPPNGEGSPPERERSEDLADEFRSLGNNLKSILQSAWESPERKKLQEEIESGMSELGSSLDQSVKEFKASPAGQRLKEDAQDFQARLRTGEVEKRLREDLLTVMHRFNAELERVSRPKPGEEEQENPAEG